MTAPQRAKRNDPCPCGSGRRFKHCCGKEGGRYRRLDVEPPTLVLNRDSSVSQRMSDAPSSGRSDHHGILIVDDFLSAGQCARLVKMSRGQLSKPGRVMVTGEPGSDQLIDKASQSRVTTTIKTFDIAEEVIPIVERGFLDHVQDHYGVRFEWFEFPGILRYDPGGHYAVHNDSEVWDVSKDSWRLGEDRQYSLLIYLNSEFIGGSVHFPELDFTVHPRPGLLLAFPSDHRYAHTALPVESGVRYVIVSWGAIVGARRVHAGARLGVVYTASDYVPAQLSAKL